MSAVDRVLVIGGGIGGLVAAKALRLQGIAVDLIEREPEWTVYGVGIIQPNNFLAALDRVGLADACLETGGAFANWRIHDLNGTVLADPPGENDAAPHLPANNGITRPRLHDILIEGARSSGASIRMGVTVSSFDDQGDYVDVVFSDGSNGRYDLVLGYDGAFSDTRRKLLGDDTKPVFAGEGVWRYNLPRPAEVDTGMIFFGPDTKVGLVPLASDLMYMFVVSAEKDGTWYDGPSLAQEMQNRIAAYGGLVAELRELITDPQGVVYRPMINLLVDRPWNHGRILLVGDAAHVTTPHLAQGAAMAVEDAVLLAELLGQDRDLDGIFAEFMDRRFKRVSYVVECSTQLAAWEMAEWAGQPVEGADPGGLLHRATAALMESY